MIYVDDIKLHNGKHRCHLAASTKTQLHQFARRTLGLSGWSYHSGSKPHYDLTENQRICAIQLGAVPVSSRELVRYCFDLAHNEDLKRWLEEALDNCLENGYDEVVDWKTEDLVEDLQRYDADFEDLSTKQLLPYVQNWQEKQRRRCVDGHEPEDTMEQQAIESCASTSNLDPSIADCECCNGLYGHCGEPEYQNDVSCEPTCADCGHQL